MRVKSKRFGGFLRWFTVATLLATLAIQSVPQVTYAAPFDDINTLNTKSQVLSEFRVIASGICQFNASADQEHINAGTWFTGKANIGMIVDGEDGKVECENNPTWIRQLLGAAGITDYAAAYRDIKSSGGNATNYISSRLFGTSATDPTGVMAARYQALLAAFTSPNGCKATATQLTTADGEGEVHSIYYYEPGVNANPANYIYDWGDRRKNVPVGYSVATDGVMECLTIAESLKDSKYAYAARDWVAADPTARTASAALNGASGVKDACASLNVVIGWILCPVIKLIDGAISGLDGAMEGLMIIDRDQFDSENLKQAWSAMRNIALAVLLPLMLVMVAGTALDWGPFDAYTAKKAFPRLVLAIFFIVLSYPICVFLVELSNAAGAGVLGLISSAFGQGNGGEPVTLSTLMSAGDGVMFSAFTGIGVWAAFTVGAASLGIVGSFALVALVGLLVGFLVLVLRQIVILAAIVLAPVAILSWVFPGNDKLWKLWKESFQGALLFFVIFMAFVGLGRGFAVIARDGSTPFTPFIILIAYVGPYFLIKQIAAMGGSALSALSGMSHGATQGFMASQRKYRQNRRQKDMAKFMAGQRGGAAARRFGEGLGTFLESDAKGKLASSYFRGAAGASDRREAIAIQRKMNQARWGQTDRAKATKDNDAMLRAQLYSEDDARRGLERDWGMSGPAIDAAISAARMNGGFSQDRANYAARALAATGTGYRNLDDLHRTVAMVAQSDSEANDLFGEINAVTKGVGRHDLATGHSVHMEMFNRAGGVGGYRMGARFLSHDDEEAGYVQAFKDVDGVTFMRDKKVGVDNMSRAVTSTFNATQRRAQAGDQAAREELGVLAGHIGKVERSFDYASSTNSETTGTLMTQPTSGENSLMQVQGPNGTHIWVAQEGRLHVAQESSRTRTQINETTGQVETILRANTSGSGGGGGAFVVDPNTGQAVPFDNPSRDTPVRPAAPGAEAAGKAYDRNRPQGVANPFDPRRQG